MRIMMLADLRCVCGEGSTEGSIGSGFMSWLHALLKRRLAFILRSKKIPLLAIMYAHKIYENIASMLGNIRCVCSLALAGTFIVC